MAKLTKKVNFRVEVYPRVPFLTRPCDVKESFWIAECERIKKEISRHVDDCTVMQVHDTEEVCEHCGYTWTEGDSPHNGGCCQKDCEVFDKYSN